MLYFVGRYATGGMGTAPQKVGLGERKQGCSWVGTQGDGVSPLFFKEDASSTVLQKSA